MHSIRLTSFVGPAALLIAGVAAGWVAHRTLAAHAADHAEDEGDEKKPEAMQVQVVTVAPERGALPLLVTVIGVVEADPSALRTLSARAGGRVLQTLVAKGQLLRAGEPMLRFDPAPLEAALLQHKSALAVAANQRSEFEQVGRARTESELHAAQARAAAELELAQAQLERLTPLRAEGLVAEKTLADARVAVAKSRLEHDNATRAAAAWREHGGALQLATLVAGEDAARAAVGEAARALADAELAAPCDGRVLALAVRAGDRCEPLAPLGTLLAGDQRLIVFGATPEVAARIPAAANVTWIDAGGQPQKGTVARVAAQVGQDGLVDVAVTVAPGVAPPPGLIVRGEIEIGSTPEATLVPLAALLRQGETTYVVLQDDKGKAHRTEVKVLARGRTQAAITGEFGAGARVVTGGGYNVPDGTVLVEAKEHDEGKH